MKKNVFIFAAASIFALVACSKAIEQDLPEENIPTDPQVTEWTYISAQGESVETKARVDDNTAEFSWIAGDKIAVFSGGNYHISNGLASNTTSAEFAFAGSIDAGRTDFAVYPASLVYDGNSVRTGSLNDHTAASLKITLPNSYKLSDVKDNKAITPMIAVNEPGQGLEFKSVCALLRITVQFIPKDTHTLKISFPGKKIQGEFLLENFVAGTNGVPAGSDPADGEDTITITDLGISSFTNSLMINIPVPTNIAVKYVRVAAYDSYNGVSHKINSIDAPIVEISEGGVNVPKKWNPNRTTSRKVTAKLPYFKSNQKTSKRVVFAPGNLVATLTAAVPTDDSNPTGQAENWRFAAHQYDALGSEGDGNKFLFGAGTTGNDIDLFAWIGESASYDYDNDPNTNAKYGILWPVSDRTTYCGNVFTQTKLGTYTSGGKEVDLMSTTADKIKYNWANLFNGVEYTAGTWRLPNDDREGNDTANEWNRLANSRTPDGGGSYVSAKATIMDGTTVKARGLILFPDRYTHPYGVKALVNYTRSAMPASHWADNEISLDEWKILEEVGGCAFLPVTSLRVRNSGSDITTYFGELAYWSEFATSESHGAAMIASDTDYCNKSLNTKKVDGVNVASTAFSGAKSCDRKYGAAVRLIRDVN